MMKLLVVAVVAVGFFAGAAIAVDIDLRDRMPVFHYLQEAMYLREAPGMDADTLHTLPAGTILRLGPVDPDGWARVGDVTGRHVGFIYARSDRIMPGLPVAGSDDELAAEDVRPVESLALECGLTAGEAALLLRRTRTTLRRAGHTDLTAVQVADAILTGKQISDVPLSCRDVADFVAAGGPTATRPPRH